MPFKKGYYPSSIKSDMKKVVKKQVKNYDSKMSSSMVKEMKGMRGSKKSC